MTEGQQLALDQLRDVEAIGDGMLEVLSMAVPQAEGDPLRVTVSVACGSYRKIDGGLPLRDRERLLLVILAGFPFKIPWVYSTHRRFAGSPHVQWGSYLCLYLAPDSEWDPSDGILGLLDRLDELLRLGALGALDPIGGPMHPPVAYTAVDHLVIPRANVPELGGEDWFGVALLDHVSTRRTDVVGWEQHAKEELEGRVGAAILLADPLTFFEFPKSVRDLLLELSRHGVSIGKLILTLQLAALRRGKQWPLLVLLGAPMRGIAGALHRHQHVTAWQIAPEVADNLLLSLGTLLDDESLQKAGKDAEDRFWKWASEAKTDWCTVREDRPEVTIRRDRDAPSSLLGGKRVAVWGCGALGGYVAEFVVRAGAKKVLLIDRSKVAPGLLVRQPYADADIGEAKAVALANRLQRIFPGRVEVLGSSADVIRSLDQGNAWHADLDLVIDCTASRQVLKKLEHAIGRMGRIPVDIASFVVGPRAEQGLSALARKGYTGGPADALRKTKVALQEEGTGDAIREFWPDKGRDRGLFQPEPGCSDVTFMGSAADVAGLAAAMLNQLLGDLGQDEATGVVRWLPPSSPVSVDEQTTVWRFERDEVLQDRLGGYSVRMAPEARQEVQRWINDARPRYGRRVETGGILFGQRDDAARVIWVDSVLGPPLDSEASEAGFLCGTIGVSERDAELRDVSDGATRFVGMWHTHPDAVPLPSEEDHRGMAVLLASTGQSTGRMLLVIIGGELETAPDTRAFTFAREDIAGGLGRQDGSRLRPMYPIRLRVFAALRRGRRTVAHVSTTLHGITRSVKRWLSDQ